MAASMSVGMMRIEGTMSSTGSMSNRETVTMGEIMTSIGAATNRGMTIGIRSH
jgi:hypothetical protein